MATKQNDRLSGKAAPQVIFAVASEGHLQQQQQLHQKSHQDLNSERPSSIVISSTTGTPLSIPRFIFSHPTQKQSTRRRDDLLNSDNESYHSPSPPTSPHPPPDSGFQKPSNHKRNSHPLDQSSPRHHNSQQSLASDIIPPASFRTSSPPPPMSPAPPSSLPTPTTQQSFSLPPTPHFDFDNQDLFEPTIITETTTNVNNDAINNNNNKNNRNSLLNPSNLLAYLSSNEHTSPFPARRLPTQQHESPDQDLEEPVLYMPLTPMKSKALSLSPNLTRNRAKEFVKQPKHRSLTERIRSVVWRFGK
eukprot:c8289_g1_i1.p1 GENE.c8289_g1_i1~~c8289_g1_i1.p1  ORF type:complete len:304 (-),score=53.81 c8289_g1_i1:383-1294(-)